MNDWTENMHTNWLETVTRWIAYRATEDNPEGLTDCSNDGLNG